jgi:hypothetical protein
VLDYLGRYTHRVALSNDRIRAIEDDHVVLRYRDRTDGDTPKIAQIQALAFIGRFLQHVLPDRFVRIRHYEFLSNRAKKQALAQCRTLLGGTAEPPPTSPKSTRQWVLELTGVDIQRCPACGEPTLYRVAVIRPRAAGPAAWPRIRAPPAALRPSSSPTAELSHPAPGH